MSDGPRNVSRDPLRVVLYVRVSTPGQAERGFSREGQLHEGRQYAAEHGLTIVHEYVEDGVSGTDDDREEFQRMVGDVLSQDSRVSAVLVVHSSRFARNLEHAILWRGRLERAGVKVIATQQPFIEGDLAPMLHALLAAWDQIESTTIGSRTRSGMAATARAQFFPGATARFPFSIEYVEGPGGATKQKLALDPIGVETSKEIFALYQTQGAASVAANLNGRGLLRRGRRWDRDSILKVISDEAMIGIYWWGQRNSRTGCEYPRDQWVPITVERIIGHDLWERAQRLRRQRDPVRHPGRETSSPMLLAGLVRCSRCRRTYQLGTSGKRRSDGSRYEFYQCSSSRRATTATCPGRPVAAEALDEAVINKFVEALLSPERCSALLRDAVEKEGVLRGRIAAHRHQWAREHAGLVHRRARLLEAIETTDAPPAVLVSRLAEVEQRLNEVGERLARVVVLHDAPPWLDEPATVEAFRARLIENVRARQEVVRGYLHELGVRITVSADGVTITSALADDTETKASMTPALPARRTGS